eukprot:3586861-Alexandrium_andersonii.AAC.1
MKEYSRKVGKWCKHALAALGSHMFWWRLRVFNTARQPIMHLHNWLKPEPHSPSDGAGKLLPLLFGK